MYFLEYGWYDSYGACYALRLISYRIVLRCHTKFERRLDTLWVLLPNLTDV